MKIINFTATEILPSLLDKSKTQTIRPAWKDIIGKPQKDKLGSNITATFSTTEERPPRFVVGDKVKLEWTGSYTALQLAKGIGMHDRVLGTVEINEVFKIEMNTNFGKYGITHTNLDAMIRIMKKGYEKEAALSYFMQELAVKDGFGYTGKRSNTIACFPEKGYSLSYESHPTPKEMMFKYFDKNYDLSMAREFWTYRWVWK